MRSKHLLATIKAMATIGAIIQCNCIGSPLVVSENSTTSVILAGYQFWWGASDGYDFNNVPGSSDLSTYKSDETSYLTTGTWSSTFKDTGHIIYTAPTKNLTINGNTYSAQSISPIGYYSHEDSVIAYHAAILKEAGVNAIMADHSNSIYDMYRQPMTSGGTTDYFAYYNNAAAIDAAAQSTLTNSKNKGTTTTLSNLYHLYKKLDSLANSTSGPDIKILPLAGAFHDADFNKGSDSLSPFQRQILTLLALQSRFPDRNIEYNDKPLINIFIAIPDIGENDSSKETYTSKSMDERITTATQQIADLTSIGNLIFTENNVNYTLDPSNITFRFESGCIESIPQLWSSNPRQDNPPYLKTKSQIWSWYDRIHSNQNPSIEQDGYQSYATTSSGLNVEYTSAIPINLAYLNTSTSTTLERIGSLRNGEQFYTQLSAALQLKPKFLYIGQFNQFVNDGSGFTEEGMLNFEPSDVTRKTYDIVHNGIKQYKALESSDNNPRISDIAIRGQLGTGEDTLICGFILQSSSNIPQRVGIVGSTGAMLNKYGLSPYSKQPTIQLFSNYSSTTGVAEIDVTNTNWRTDQSKIYQNTLKPSLATPSYNYANFLTDRDTAYDPSVNYLTDSENNVTAPAIFADINPGAHYVIFGDQNLTSAYAGPTTWGRVHLEDKISDSKLVNVSARGYISGQTNKNLILAITTLGSVSVNIRLNQDVLTDAGFSHALSTPRLRVISSTGTTLNTWTDTIIHNTTLSKGLTFIIVDSATTDQGGTCLIEVNTQ